MLLLLAIYSFSIYVPGIVQGILIHDLQPTWQIYGRDITIHILWLRKLKSEKACNLPNARIQTSVCESPKYPIFSGHFSALFTGPVKALLPTDWMFVVSLLEPHRSNWLRVGVFEWESWLDSSLPSCVNLDSSSPFF